MHGTDHSAGPVTYRQSESGLSGRRCDSMDLSMGKVLSFGLTNLVVGEWWPSRFTWTSGSLTSPTPNSNLCSFLHTYLVSYSIFQILFLSFFISSRCLLRILDVTS